MPSETLEVMVDPATGEDTLPREPKVIPIVHNTDRIFEGFKSDARSYTYSLTRGALDHEGDDLVDLDDVQGLLAALNIMASVIDTTEKFSEAFRDVLQDTVRQIDEYNRSLDQKRWEAEEDDDDSGS